MDSPHTDTPDVVYPLDVYLCEHCTHLQLLDILDPELLFGTYRYVSSTSPVFVRHFKEYVASVSQRVGISEGDLVVDIGSNDGTLLNFFQQQGARILGIDPAINLAQEASQKGIETWPEFFTADTSTRITQRCGHARIVTANNVLAHIDDLPEVIRGIASTLASDGVLVFEVSYLVDVIQKRLFDTIYHEHLDYHSIIPLTRFLELHGMDMFAAERIPTHGGSMRGFVQLAGGPHEHDGSVERLAELEGHLGLHDPATFKDFEEQISLIKKELTELVSSIKRDGHTIAGYGAPAKATTLLHEFRFDRTVLDFIVDDNPLKQGLFTPGHRIPIEPAATIVDQEPAYVLVLAWNFADAIIEKERQFAARGGRFIIPLPEVKVV